MGSRNECSVPLRIIAVMLLWFGYEVSLEKTHVAMHWWLTPVILATQEAEIRKITVPK
jgi:hypothetical protein